MELPGWLIGGAVAVFAGQSAIIVALWFAYLKKDKKLQEEKDMRLKDQRENALGYEELKAILEMKRRA